MDADPRPVSWRSLAAALAALAVIVAGYALTSGDLYLDGHQVEGSWVSNATEPCPFGDRCDAALAVARSALLARQPAAEVVGLAFHSYPTKRRDGTFAAFSIPSYFIVLTLADGSERLESFQCGIGGELTVGSPEGFRQFCPRPPTPRPTTSLLDVASVGPISRPLSLAGGDYGFRWSVTAGETDCTIAIVLDGPAGSLVVDDYGRVAAHQSASAKSPAAALDAGAYTVRLDTDCPGESRLWMWRYLD